MSTKRYKMHRVYLLPEHIEWMKKQAKKSGISVSQLERILKDMAQDMDIDKIVHDYEEK